MSESKPERLTDRLPFLGGLWLAIATALLCALLPSGLPGTETRGSAFNPSNSVVALRAKSTKAVPDMEAVAGKDKAKPEAGRQNGNDLTLPSLVAIGFPLNLLPLPVANSRRVVPSPESLLNALFARGPPLSAH